MLHIATRTAARTDTRARTRVHTRLYARTRTRTDGNRWHVPATCNAAHVVT